jgi:hypothetical protein
MVLWTRVTIGKNHRVALLSSESANHERRHNINHRLEPLYSCSQCRSAFVWRQRHLSSLSAVLAYRSAGWPSLWRTGGLGVTDNNNLIFRIGRFEVTNFVLLCRKLNYVYVYILIYWFWMNIYKIKVKYSPVYTCTYKNLEFRWKNKEIMNLFNFSSNQIECFKARYWIRAMYALLSKKEFLF